MLAGFSISTVAPFTALPIPSDGVATFATFTGVRLSVSSSWAASGLCRNTEAKQKRVVKRKGGNSTSLIVWIVILTENSRSNFGGKHC